jgi:hypothetical protein
MIDSEKRRLARQIFADMYLIGLSDAHIARKAGCSRQMVWQVRHGICRSPEIRKTIIEATKVDRWALS